MFFLHVDAVGPAVGSSGLTLGVEGLFKLTLASKILAKVRQGRHDTDGPPGLWGAWMKLAQGGVLATF